MIFNIYPYADDDMDDENVVAECLEVPVIVRGKSERDVMQKMKHAIEGYFEAFPEERRRMFDCFSLEIGNHKRD